MDVELASKIIGVLHHPMKMMEVKAEMKDVSVKMIGITMRRLVLEGYLRRTSGNWRNGLYRKNPNFERDNKAFLLRSKREEEAEKEKRKRKKEYINVPQEVRDERDKAEAKAMQAKAQRDHQEHLDREESNRIFRERKTKERREWLETLSPEELANEMKLNAEAKAYQDAEAKAYRYAFEEGRGHRL